jgi:TRAP-type C4-dicarboxylate transport system permease small subunit
VRLILRAAWRGLSALRQVELALGVSALTLIVVIICVQVTMRYVLNRPIVWAEDVATFLFIWAVFLGAAVGLKDLRHIRIETFLDRLPPRLNAATQALLYAVVLACCVAVARYAWDVMDTEARSMTISLPVNVPRHWFYSVPLFCALVSMAATALVLVVGYLNAAVTGAPVDAAEDAKRRRAEEHAREEAELRAVEKVL